MVVFTCGNCGESVKKPGVQKHYGGRCRGPPHLTCVDCFKDFRGAEYEAHIKCLTEEERYSAKGFVSKPSSNKGEKKQQSWYEAVLNVLNSDRQLSKDERELLTLVSNHENLPRKKAKFMNFLSNAYRSYARKQDLVERVWNIIEEVGKAATVNVSSINGNSDTPSDKTKQETAEQPEDIKSKKRKTNEPQESGTETETPKKKKKRANSENGDVKTNGEQTDALENGTKTPKKKKIRENSENEDVKKSEEKEPSVVESYAGELGGILKMQDVSLYKLMKAVSKHCGEDNSKLLKQVQKQIIVRSMSLNFP